MCDVSVDRDQCDCTSATFIRELATSADEAQVTGDQSRCVAIVENIYDLLDRQSRVPARPRSQKAKAK